MILPLTDVLLIQNLAEEAIGLWRKDRRHDNRVRAEAWREGDSDPLPHEFRERRLNEYAYRVLRAHNLAPDHGVASAIGKIASDRRQWKRQRLGQAGKDGKGRATSSRPRSRSGQRWLFTQ